MNDIAKRKPAGQAVPRAVLDRIRAARPAKVQPGSIASAVGERRPRLVFGFDATASREDTWESARRITDRLFEAIPGAVDVALAVHGGNVVHTFTEFSNDVGRFRDQAAAVACRSGTTRLCELMSRTANVAGVKVMVYIGDAFEEQAEAALALANRFKAHGIKAVILADDADAKTLGVFQAIADRTGGALLDFRAEDSNLMGEVLASVALLAAGGRALLERHRTQGAQLLLEHLKD